MSMAQVLPQAVRSVDAFREHARPHPVLHLVDGVMPAPEPKKELVYIHRMAPMKGAKVARDGQCLYLMQCFSIPDNATSGQIRAMEITAKDWEYRTFYGYAGAGGIGTGYVYECTGNARTIDSARHVYLATPRKIDSSTHAPRFGDQDDRVRSIAHQIMTSRLIEARLNPRQDRVARRNLVCGG